MAKNTDEIVVGANGSVLVAPLSADVPADIDEAFSADWIDLGYTSEDGVTVTDSKTQEAIRVWQLFYPARRIVTERDFTAAFVLRQFSRDTTELALGGTVSEDGPGAYRLTAPEPGAIDLRQVAIVWNDGTKNYRWLIYRGSVTDNVEIPIARTAPTDLAVTFGIAGADGETPWDLLTDDPAFEPAGS